MVAMSSSAKSPLRAAVDFVVSRCPAGGDLIMESDGSGVIKVTAANQKNGVAAMSVADLQQAPDGLWRGTRFVSRTISNAMASLGPGFAIQCSESQLVLSSPGGRFQIPAMPTDTPNPWAPVFSGSSERVWLGKSRHLAEAVQMAQRFTRDFDANDPFAGVFMGAQPQGGLVVVGCDRTGMVRISIPGSFSRDGWSIVCPASACPSLEDDGDVALMLCHGGMLASYQAGQLRCPAMATEYPSMVEARLRDVISQAATVGHFVPFTHSSLATAMAAAAYASDTCVISLEGPDVSTTGERGECRVVFEGEKAPGVIFRLQSARLRLALSASPVSLTDIAFVDQMAPIGFAGESEGISVTYMQAPCKL